ncbi:3-oxoadipate enol-lactonase [Bailinhaonella thermotolerans]|uniref:3-oxoadipate enol-lactonase n=1 Tax=Bailinhaonella thermotolerans TaxID=1070861 RepID=A0A3A4BDS4_9ACTN|nr:3-oxoadipate enol-lactonase [Bailinhaonella thermotolerans]RJL32450.1 3-oxoadipate enol-lactonase [Bailinhaonella thermotolerans]
MIDYEISGPDGAPVVVLGSSLGTTRRMWDDVLPALTPRFRVLRYDHRGHGSRPVPAGPYEIADLGRDVLDLMDRLGVVRAHHAGLSLGGMVAMWIAAHAPERVDRLALLCTSARLGPPEMWADRARAVREGGTASLASATAGRWFTAAYREFRPDRVAEVLGMLADTPDEGYAACCGAIERMDLLPDLPKIAAPTLVIAGDADPSTPADPHGRMIAGAVPGARLEIVPGAHLVAVERPDLVTRLLLDHFTEPVRPGPGDPGDVGGSAGPIGAAGSSDARGPGSPSGSGAAGARPYGTGRGATEGGAGRSAGDPRWAAGDRVRREVLGDEHVDRAWAAATEFTGDFQDFVTRYAWGEVWAREGLDRRTRSCVTLALLAALGHEGELAMHVRAALRNGVSPAEIREVLLQTGLYAGVPVANRAFAIAREVLDGRGAV